MKKSESIVNLSKALANFQKECGKIIKDGNNPFFKSKYASLPHILDMIREPLEKSGLCFTQFPTDTGLTTLIIHSETGEYLESTCTIYLAKNDSQAYGSAITYMRRYSLVSALGLNVDEDDDGNAASGKSNSETPKATELPWLEDKNVDKVAMSAKEKGLTIEDLKKYYRISKKNQETLTNLLK